MPAIIDIAHFMRELLHILSTPPATLSIPKWEWGPLPGIF
jgi:hypothetical protein